MNRLLCLLAAVLWLSPCPPSRAEDLATARNDQLGRLRNYVLDAIQPSGLVRDALVLDGADFHPATPDAAGFALLSLAALDHVGQLEDAGERVEAILRAYAGQTPGVTPGRSADGHFLHWMDLNTGEQAPGGWPVEYTPIGSALLVAGAQFAANHFTERPDVQLLASRLTTSIDFDAAIHPSLDGRLYLTMAETGGGGPGTVRPWNEYMLVESLALKQPKNDRAEAVLDHWLTVDNLPTRNFLGIDTLTDNPNRWAPAFWVQQMHFFNGDFRHHDAFETFFDNQRRADKRYSEVVLDEAFRYGLTAGVSPQGYHADRLADHPNEVFSPEAVAAWGDMATFLEFYDRQVPTSDPRYQYGLVRESDAQPNWVPNDAGLVDHLYLLFGLVESIDADFFAERMFVAYIPGDFDDNGWVAGSDLLQWQRDSGVHYDAADFAAWEANYGTPLPASPIAVPEPILALHAAAIAASLLCLLRRPRKLATLDAAASGSLSRRRGSGPTLIKDAFGCCTVLGFFTAAAVVPAACYGEQAILRRPETTAALNYQFTDDDEHLLSEIQRGCFEFLWKEVGRPAPLVKDRLTNDRVASLAGVGFQLSALPIGVERGWITHAAGEQRAREILRSILPRDDNKKFGIYLHYVDLNSGGMHHDPKLQVQASTVDHALLQAGAMPAAVYFGGEVRELVDRMIREANWKIYCVPLNENLRNNQQTNNEQFISFGWRPDDLGDNLSTPGSFRPWSWYKASAEEHLVTFLAVGSPVPEHAVEPEMYYRLHRVMKRHREMPPFAVSWSSPAFTYFFAHCWIDFRQFGADDPTAFGVDQPPIDWWENSHRALQTHRTRCVESVDQFKTFAVDRWGMSPGADVNPDGTIGYVVQSIRPSMEGKDNFHGGTVMPYAAGSAIMFMPEESVAALRAYRHLKNQAGELVVWRDPDEGGYGLLDSFNLDRTEMQAAPDYLSIDEGPMILAIENARTGLIWDLFMRHPSAQLAVERLRWTLYAERNADE